MERLTIDELVECRMRALMTRAKQIAEYPNQRPFRGKISRRVEKELKKKGDLVLTKRHGKRIPRIEGWREKETGGFLSQFLAVQD
jgi:hypothetical protein